VDLSLQNEKNENVLTIDIERWSQWVDEWPDYYKHIHFLGRKEKFIQPDIPFFMGYMNYHRTKVLMISKEDIQKYPTIDKYFRRKQTTDRLKELPMSEGYVFGENITEKERRLFK
jgi:hypothetical protein